MSPTSLEASTPIRGWIFLDHLMPFCRNLAQILGHDFGLADEETIALGVRDTNWDDTERRYEYPMWTDTSNFRLVLGEDEDAVVVMFALTGDVTETLRIQVDVLSLVYSNP
ncbi:hypothetical protein [Stackebrandtia soli]|uniref:hypothetical protein n=1 Tax=Stackebrandtia soli TaxID=1892856 RepID=UPI0039EC4F14